MEAAPILYDDVRRLVTCGDKSISLSRQEAIIWRRLAARTRSLVVWDELEFLIDPECILAEPRSSVQVAVWKINAKLEKAEIPVKIDCVWGEGLVLPHAVGFVSQPNHMAVGPDEIRLIRLLIKECRDPLLAEEATRHFLDRKLNMPGRPA